MEIKSVFPGTGDLYVLRRIAKVLHSCSQIEWYFSLVCTYENHHFEWVLLEKLQVARLHILEIY
ncbi:hypothetical protein [Billgrantia antri]|uniref:Uncharacterized protein n=1 Tax=Billgrantia antri TaxID=2846777 RepID=A0ABS6ZTR0_9GAMM|nr:hypothetical protein [Halomonas antri]MBW6393462.1 hypothetical protein [Halomonas antri]